MPVFVNFKICDNADVCSGVEVCTTGAMYWDEKEGSVKTDNTKCISCDSCVESCPAGAIRVAHNEYEEDQIKKDFLNDPRTINDLMVERYGASPIGETTLIRVHEAVSKIQEAVLMLTIEIIDDKDTPCLINSVPIAEIFTNSAYEYYKVSTHDADYEAFSKTYKITDCPTLLLFKDHTLLVRVDGAVENLDYSYKTAFINKIRSAIAG